MTGDVTRHVTSNWGLRITKIRLQHLKFRLGYKYIMCLTFKGPGGLRSIFTLLLFLIEETKNGNYEDIFFGMKKMFLAKVIEF